MNKCTVTDGKFVDPCPTLAKVTEYGHPRGKQKGIFAWDFSSLEEGPTRTFFGVKSGEYVQRGLAFNYCPFCGEKIDAPFAEDDTASGRAQRTNNNEG